MITISGSLITMEIEGGQVHSTQLLDLCEGSLVSIFCLLDIESLVMVARASKKLNELTQNDLLWKQLCRSWEHVVNLESWCGQMDSRKSLFRLLFSLSKLVGMWTDSSAYPHGALLYVTWGFGGLEGWQVTPKTSDRIEFIKLLDVIGAPDGSHKVELDLPVEEAPESVDSVSARIVLPSSQTPNQFVLETQHASGTELTRNTNGMGLAVTGNKNSRKLYKKLEFGEPTPGRELTGLWTGLYDGHGMEILAVSYSDDGYIVGMKVTGDPNVPCGEISFKASIGMESSDFPEDAEILTNNDPSHRLMKMYRGQGRIAEQIFWNPRWVLGSLLVEQGGNFHFVWDDWGPVSYYRFNLEAAFKGRNIGGSS